MWKIIRLIILSITIVIGVFLLGIQIANIYMNKTLEFTLDSSLLWFTGNNDYFYLVSFIAFFLVLDVLFNTLFSKKERDKRNKKRMLNRDERLSYAHICKTHEAKKGLQRMEFDSYGHLRNISFRNIIDILFDPLKVIWNNFLIVIRAKDVHKFNILKKWNINHQEVTRRGGFPILTYKKRIYVDAEDSHNMIIGTTNSGKTFSSINILLDSLRMAGESMVINDPKGELLKTHKKQLEEDGYNVLVLDFIEPNKSDCWNPLDIITRSYRKQQNLTDEQLQEYEIYREAITDLEKDLVNEEDDEIKQKIIDQITKIQNNMPEADFTTAEEYIEDLCHNLTYEENAKDGAFWNSNAATLLNGLINLLLEEKEMDSDTGEMKPLSDELINFKSIQLTFQAGEKVIDKKGGTLLGLWLNQYRKSTDTSVMKLTEYVSAPTPTKGSTKSVFAEKIKIMTMNEQLMRMTSRSTFDMRDIGRKKTALFIVIHGEKSTYYPLVTIFVKQLYEELMQTAREYGSRLNVPVNLVFDEFGIFPALKDIDNILAFGRSAGFRVTMVIQDFSQLDKTYGSDAAKTIKNNVMNLEYLLGGDPKTLEEVSKRAGNRLVWDKEKGNYKEEPVISTERLSRLSMGEAVILRQRRNPIVTRLRAYNRYSFYKNKYAGDNRVAKQLPKVKYFDLNNSYQSHIMRNVKTVGCKQSAISKENSPETNILKEKNDF